MKESNVYNIRSISSFSDFAIERKRLLLKKRLIETRLQFTAAELKDLENLKRDIPLDLIRDFTMKFSAILESLFKSDGKAGAGDGETSAGASIMIRPSFLSYLYPVKKMPLNMCQLRGFWSTRSRDRMLTLAISILTLLCE